MSATTASERLLDALEMWEDGVQMMRENLRRRSPRASDEAIEAQVAAWLAGSDQTDEEHVVVPWPRQRP